MEKTNIFDWRLFREENHKLFQQKFEEYKYEGLKTEEVNKYNYVDLILKKLQEMDIELIKGYYYPLYLFHRFISNLSKLRCENVRKRKAEYKRYEEIRNKKIEERDKREETKKSKLEAAKNDFYSTFDD